MEPLSKTLDLNYLQKKLNAVRKSCTTPEQKAAYYNYVQLYRNWLARYNNNFGYHVKIDFVKLIGTSLLLAISGVTVMLYLIYLINR